MNDTKDVRTAYRTERGDVLLWIQLTLADEQDGAGPRAADALAGMRWDGVTAPVLDVVEQPAGESAPAPAPAKREAFPTKAEPAMRDPSTGAGSAAALERDLRLDRGRMHGGAFALAAIEISPLSEIRSAYGEETAEDVLRALVEAVPFVLRGGDRIYRTAPDELVLLLPSADLTAAASMCLRLQASVKDVLDRRELPHVMLSARAFERAA
ncbi:MAG TPA: GGDEF domain-containing protein [Actinomycetota bacterium]